METAKSRPDVLGRTACAFELSPPPSGGFGSLYLKISPGIRQLRQCRLSSLLGMQRPILQPRAHFVGINYGRKCIRPRGDVNDVLEEFRDGTSLRVSAPQPRSRARDSPSRCSRSEETLQATSLPGL